MQDIFIRQCLNLLFNSNLFHIDTNLVRQVEKDEEGRYILWPEDRSEGYPLIVTKSDGGQYNTILCLFYGIVIYYLHECSKISRGEVQEHCWYK